MLLRYALIVSFRHDRRVAMQMMRRYAMLRYAPLYADTCFKMRYSVIDITLMIYL